MTFPEITQVLKRETEAWNAHDADGVAACYAQDAVLYDVGLPEPLRGRVAIRDAVAGYLTAFSDFHADMGEPIVSSNRAAQDVEGHRDKRRRAVRRPADRQERDHIRLRNGRVRRGRVDPPRR